MVGRYVGVHRMRIFTNSCKSDRYPKRMDGGESSRKGRRRMIVVNRVGLTEWSGRNVANGEWTRGLIFM